MVTSTADDGSPGTLRAAIDEANAAPGPAEIDFAIPGSGVQTITLMTDLPAITNQVDIDGASQGGPGYVGLPLIALVAGTTGPSPPITGLEFAAGSDGSMVQGLVLDGFDLAAIDIAAHSVTVTGNMIGTDPSGTMAVGNGNGVEIEGAGNTIGGTTTADRNIISANTNDGVLITGAGTTGNVVSGNYIGTDLTGTVALGNLSAGVDITGAADNTIGGTAPGTGNVISGNGAPEGQGAGLLINGAGAGGNLVQGNFIGTSSGGTSALANIGYGVAIVAASGNTFGGTAAGDGNVIAGNTLSGVLLAGSGTTQNVVQGNDIGIAADGTHGLGNAMDGISLQTGAVNNQIAGNVIAANTEDGVNLSGASQNQLLDNLIGTNSSGTAGLGNGQDGVRVTGQGNNNTIGGTGAGAGNTLAHNGRDGVEVESGTGNGILGNAIFANSRMGIELGAGANNNQQFPDLTGVFSTGSSTVIQGTLTSTPSTTFRLEFFANDTPDPSGFGQGQVFLPTATLSVTTASNGTAQFSETVPVALSAGQVVTATATDPNNNTSEFSADAAQTALSLSIIGMAAAQPTSGTTNLDFTVNLSVPSPLTTTVAYQTIDGTAVAGTDYLATSGTLTFPPGTTSEIIPLPIIGHTTVGPNKSFSVMLSNAQNAAITTAVGTGTIINNNQAGQFQFSMPAFVASQDGRQATITVTRTAGAASAVGVSFATIAGGSAVPGVDYTPTSGMLTFAANQASQTFTIPLLPNLLLGGNPTVALGLSNPTDGGSLGPQSTAILTILNPNSLVVTNTNDAGPGSLRQAILTANANPGANTVTFAIPGPGPYVIQPLSPLPAITDAAVIDATTQPGFQSTPIVTLKGSLAGPQTDGLEITAGATTIRGLVIDRFSGNGIVILGPGGNVIAGDLIGVDAAGDPGLGNGFDGVEINQSPNNTLGTGDVIADNGLVGVRITGAAASGNVIVGDLIGTDPTGTKALGNAYDGIYIVGASNNTIGSTSPGERNAISANASVGIQIDGPGAGGNLVEGNDIGTDVTGTRALGNEVDGVFINGAAGTVIGGPGPAQRNVISGNQLVGIRISGSGATGNILQGNYIGTDATGTAPLGNGFDGVFTINAPNNIIGGTATGAGNVISANGSVGVQFSGAGSAGNVVQGNEIGTDVTGTAALGNGLDGIFINGAPRNTIGGQTAGARNLISANGSSGIQLLAPSSSGNVVQGNAIGVDANGVARLGNAYGIFINNAAHNTVGGPGPAANRLAGNTQANTFQVKGGSTSAVLSVTPIESGGLLTTVVISSSTALDPTKAQNLRNYLLQQIGRSGGAIKLVPITSAVYDPVAQTVTLTLAHPLPAGTRVLLTVQGSAKGGPISRSFTTIIGSNPISTSTSVQGRRSHPATQNAAAIASRRISLGRLAVANHRLHAHTSRRGSL